MPSVRTCGPLVLSVLIGPLHLCPCGNGYRWRRKCEIDDIHGACLRFGRRRTIRYLDTAEQPVVFNIARARYAGREIKVFQAAHPPGILVIASVTARLVCAPVAEYTSKGSGMMSPVRTDGELLPAPLLRRWSCSAVGSRWIAAIACFRLTRKRGAIRLADGPCRRSHRISRLPASMFSLKFWQSARRMI